MNNILNILNQKILDSSYFSSNFIISFDDFKSALNNLLDYLNSFEITQQIVIFNILFNLLLLFLLIDYLAGLYANYLIEKFNLNNILPRLTKILQYKMKYQQFYFKYLILLAFSIILLSLTFNGFVLYILITPTNIQNSQLQQQIQELKNRKS